MKTARTCGLVVLILAAGATVVRPAGSEEGAALVPCLSVAADGSPVWPTTVFPAGGKQMVAAFRLGEGEKAAKLSSRWVVVDVGTTAAAGTELGKAEVDLKGGRSGRFRYSQPAPLPPGKYRLEVQADGKPWKTAEVTVAADLALTGVSGPTDLMPLKAGQTWVYDSVIELGKGAAWPEGLQPGPDGKVHKQLTVTIEAEEEAGWRSDVTMDGRLGARAWWKATPEGIVLTQRTEDAAVVKVDPPRLMVPMPKRLPVFWTWSAKEGPEKYECQMWGPVNIANPDGTTSTAYLVISDSPVEEGKETLAQVFLPGFGLGGEVRWTADSSGNLLRRHTISVAAPTGYRVTPVAAMKGRMGRLTVQFPKGSKADGTSVEVYTDAAMKNRSHSVYGGKTFELLPGRYWVSILDAVVPVEVQSRSETVIAAGSLKVELAGSTSVAVFADKACTKRLASFYGSKEVGLPVGTYYVQIGGKAEPVKIEEGKITEF